MKEIRLKIEQTKMEAVLKFTANKILTGGGYQFTNIEEAKNSPLALDLFQLPFVKRVFISANFIAIEKFSAVEWKDVQEELKEQMESYLNHNGIVVLEEKEQAKAAVEIYSERTPNPSVLKFVANIRLVENDLEFKNSKQAANDPLAAELFNFPFVREIFISENYVSITKADDFDWSNITVELRSFIKQFIAKNNSIATSKKVENYKPSPVSSKVADLDPISNKIVALLDEYVKPAVAADGGNIMFQSYDEKTKIVHVMLQGACSGCPSSTITLKNGIENMLKQLIPDKIEEVVAVNY